MKSYRFLALFSGVLTLLFALTGCTVPVMATGRYTAEDPGREDYAAVYQDKIFLHIKAPELHSGRAAYWDWAGTYELTGAGEIRPDMVVMVEKLSFYRWGTIWAPHRNGCYANNFPGNYFPGMVITEADMSTCPAYTHHGGATLNILFADGHAETIGWQQRFNGNWTKK